MNKELKNKVDNLVKSMQKSVKKVKEKNAIEDVLDANNVAEMSPDSIAVGSTSAMNKSKKKKKIPKADCHCDEDVAEPGGFEKAEDFVKSMIDNFQKISSAYLEKKEQDSEGKK